MLEEHMLATTIMDAGRVEAKRHGEAYLLLHPLRGHGQGQAVGLACWVLSHLGKALVAIGRRLEDLGVAPVLPSHERATRTCQAATGCQE
ncbi:MAG: hypothetical protein JXA93_08370 [Anaerolineae bacterium]|nr:hypothetical protein [Anaerolineae bacterium]